MGARVQPAYRLECRKAPHATFNFNFYGPGVDSASNRNEYHQYFLGVKADNLPPSCAVVTKSGNLNFLETSGPVQACNGTNLLRKTCWVSVTRCPRGFEIQSLITARIIKYTVDFNFVLPWIKV